MISSSFACLLSNTGDMVWIKLNKACCESGDILEISVKITDPGYLNVISISADDYATVLFPNQYHSQNLVSRGEFTIPTDQMSFEMVADGPQGPNVIAAFVSQSPLNSYEAGFKIRKDILADLSPNSTRALMLRRSEEQLAAGRVTVEIRGEGKCE